MDQIISKIIQFLNFKFKYLGLIPIINRFAKKNPMDKISCCYVIIMPFKPFNIFFLGRTKF
jgi:hypothetical protein